MFFFSICILGAIKTLSLSFATPGAWVCRNARTDVALMPPIRQTASIFKQPVTVYKTQESIMKGDLKHGAMQEKPKQLFWEKRLEVGILCCNCLHWKVI